MLFNDSICFSFITAFKIGYAYIVPVTGVGRFISLLLKFTIWRLHMKDGVLRNVLHINLMSASMGIGYKGSSQYTWN